MRSDSATARLAEIFIEVYLRFAAPSGEGETLTPTQVDGLRFLATHPGARVKDLAAGLKVSHPAATKLVDRLVARGFLRRVPGRDDRREVSAALTPLGAESLAHARAEAWNSLSEILARMSEPERQALDKGMAGFVRAAVTNPEEVEEICRRCGTEHDPDCFLEELRESHRKDGNGPRE